MRTGAGFWLAATVAPEGVWLLQAPNPARPELLTQRIAVVGAPGTAPLSTTAPVTGAVLFLDGADNIHLVWAAGGKAYYARCPVARAAAAEAWRGPTGGPAPEPVAADLLPTSLALGVGARPMVAGTRGGGIVVLRFDGEWHETFTSPLAASPVLLRDEARTMHLAYSGPVGVCWQRSEDGVQWQPREVALAGNVSGRPALALTGRRPVVAATVDGRAVLAARRESGWVFAPVPATGDAEASAPDLGSDRYGTVWCLWRAGDWVKAARWLGESLGPAQSLARAAGSPRAEQPPPTLAPDVGVLCATEEAPTILRLRVPGIAPGDRRPVRFIDLAELEQVEGLVREGIAPTATGFLPPPAPGEILPGGLAPWGKEGKELRAWFSRREGERWVGYTALWSRARWSAPEALQLAAPRPWLTPPTGALSVRVDEEEPEASRRLKMIAECAGPAPALLTSEDGRSWAYYAELPPLRPLCLLRDGMARVEHRWKVYGTTGDPARPTLMTSPDREHWYAAEPPGAALSPRDAALWVEEGRVLGLMEGGRRLVAGPHGGRSQPHRRDAGALG